MIVPTEWLWEIKEGEGHLWILTKRQLCGLCTPEPPQSPQGRPAPSAAKVLLVINDSLTS